MGLFSTLATLPLAPVRMVAWAAERVAEQAEDEYYDPAPIWQELAALAEERDRGEIDQESFDRREDELLDRLAEIEAFRRGT